RTRLPHVLVSSPGLLREIRRASQRGTKIKQVVANKLASVLGDQSVEGIDAARVIMIQPGAENPQSAQLTSMFMRNDVVRIIRADTVVSILPEKSPWNKLAGHGSILAIGSLPGSSENLIKVLFLHRPYFPDQIFKFGLRAQLELIA